MDWTAKPLVERADNIESAVLLTDVRNNQRLEHTPLYERPGI